MSESDFVFRLRARSAMFAVDATADAVSQFEQFYQLLSKWNRRINLTALPLNSPPADETLDRLFIEPLIASVLLTSRQHALLDLGSGAGSPAIPLKILRPHVHLTMVEPRSRKTAFLREAARTLSLTNTKVVEGRYQQLSDELSGKFDMVTVRALRIDASLLETVERLLAPGGCVMLFGHADPPQGWNLLDRRQLPDASLLSVCRPLGFPGPPG